MKSFLHFLQVMSSGEFKMFDYGKPDINRKHYGGQDEPPHYPWERLKDLKKIVLVCGTSDHLTDPVDYNRLKKNLEEQNALMEFMEVNLGHVGTTIPGEGYDDHLKYIVNDLLKKVD